MTISSTYLKATRFEEIAIDFIQDTWLREDGLWLPATISRCIHNTAQERKIPKIIIKQILESLPSDFLESRCFLDRLTGLWRYEFGSSMRTLKSTNKCLNYWPPIKELMEVLFCAYSYLSTEKYKKYVEKLSDPNKHEDHLVEMFPMLWVKKNKVKKIEFEAKGYSPGNKDIAWLFEFDNGHKVLIDVKRRMYTIDSLMDSHNLTKIPDHCHTSLFRSVEDKYEEIENSDTQLQGVWIVSYVKQNAVELQKAFEKLNKKKIHFAIFANNTNDAYILARRDEDKSQLIEYFGLKHSNEGVFI